MERDQSLVAIILHLTMLSRMVKEIGVIHSIPQTEQSRNSVPLTTSNRAIHKIGVIATPIYILHAACRVTS